MTERAHCVCQQNGFCVQEAACGCLCEEQPGSAGLVLSALGQSRGHEPVAAVQKAPQNLAGGFPNAGLALGRQPVPTEPWSGDTLRQRWGFFGGITISVSRAQRRQGPTVPSP